MLCHISLSYNKPGGSLFISTINRTRKSYALAILGAEYLLRLVPPGTHTWDKFVRPTELTPMLSRYSEEFTHSFHTSLCSFLSLLCCILSALSPPLSALSLSLSLRHPSAYVPPRTSLGGHCFHASAVVPITGLPAKEQSGARLMMGLSPTVEGGEVQKQNRVYPTYRTMMVPHHHVTPSPQGIRQALPHYQSINLSLSLSQWYILLFVFVFVAFVCSVCVCVCVCVAVCECVCVWVCVVELYLLSVLCFLSLSLCVCVIVCVR